MILLKYFLKFMKKKCNNLLTLVKYKHEKIKAYVDYDDNLDALKVAYEDLAPKDNIDKEGVYARALDWALKNDKILNIALTGAYGSGKSSILRTYEKKRPNNNYLNISLASFRSNNGQIHDETKVNNGEEGKFNKLDDIEIEKGILQQLFYKVNSKKIPYTRFRKIKNISTIELIRKTCFVLTTIITGILIFLPKSITTVKSNIYTLIGFKFPQNSIILLYIIFFVFSLKIVIDILKYCNKGLKLNKIKLEKAEIELEKANDESIFNRYLDEILYFFQVTNYNVVFIEDLDRFDDINILTKLRELNSLINNSEQINKKVVFIYAIKDEMFANKDRTKFFEFIIPVIPVINSSNSGELLLDKIKKDNLEEALSETFINDITIYIDDMRILNNTYNEFILYKQTLGDVSLNLEKLLAIIVYKNIYPDDFAKLQYNKGIVYQAFEKKNATILKLVKEIKDKSLSLEEELRISDKEHLNSLRELKAAFLYTLAQGRTDITQIILNDSWHNISSFFEENFELSIFKNKRVQIHTYNGNNIHATIDEIDAMSGNEKGFLERAEIVKLKNKSRQEEIKQELAVLRKKEILVKSWSLFDVIQEVGAESFFDETSKQKKLIIFLLRNGHIDEMYPTYITYFYPGSLTQKDMNFIMSIKDQEALDPSYQLTKLDKIVTRMNRNEFERREVLNYNLIDFILENHIKYNEYFKLIIEQLSNESDNSIIFVDLFKDITRYKELFIKLLVENWDNIWIYIENKSNFSILKKDEYLKHIIMFSNIESIVKINKEQILTQYISDKADFVSLMSTEQDICKIQNVLKELDVKFKKIKNTIGNNELLEFIFENNLYEINQDMIELIVQYKFPDSVQNIAHCNYTTIKQVEYLPLINYIDNNFDDYIDNVFLHLENNDSETEETVINLLNREGLLPEVKYKIIEKEKVCFNDITSIENELWGKVLSDCKVKPSWFNIISYFEFIKEIDVILISFFVKSYNFAFLASNKCNYDSDFDESVYKDFSNAIIQCEVIEEDIFIGLSRSIPYKYNRLDTSHLSGNRVFSIINCDLLNFTVENYGNIRENHKDKLVLLLEKHMESFIKELSNFEFDNYDLNNILKSSVINLEQKVTLINKIDNSIVNDDLNLLELICDIMISYNKDSEINQQLLKDIFEKGFKVNKKVGLLIKQIKYLGTQEITAYLEMLGNPYKDITINRRKPLIDKTVTNIRLVQGLKDHNYIASFTSEGSKLRVHTKYK